MGTIARAIGDVAFHLAIYLPQARHIPYVIADLHHITGNTSGYLSREFLEKATSEGRRESVSVAGRCSQLQTSMTLRLRRNGSLRISCAHVLSPPVPRLVELNDEARRRSAFCR